MVNVAFSESHGSLVDVKSNVRNFGSPPEADVVSDPPLDVDDCSSLPHPAMSNTPVNSAAPMVRFGDLDISQSLLFDSCSPTPLPYQRSTVRSRWPIGAPSGAVDIARRPAIDVTPSTHPRPNDPQSSAASTLTASMSRVPSVRTVISTE
jgi:hypothetical protein